MAACGLAPGLGNSENIRKDQGNHVVIALLKFAACLMQTLKKMNGENGQEMKLRIGKCLIRLEGNRFFQFLCLQE